jgi:hypothetical protein
VKILALAGISIALLFASFNFFARDDITRITGVVTAISADFITLDVADREPQGTTIGVLRSTLFLQDGQPASWKDLRVGTEIDADATTNSNELYAINVAFEKQPARGHTESSPPRRLRSYDAYWQFGNRPRSETKMLRVA